MQNFKKIIILLSLTFFSCTEQKNVKISGKITNALEQERFVTFLKADQSFSQVINLKEDDSFEELLTIAKDGYFIMKYGQRYALLYLEKGGDLHIELDNDTPQKEINFRGSLSDINTYLIKKQEIANALQKKMNDIATKTQEEFLEALEYRQEQLSALIPKKNTSFIAMEKNNIAYEKIYLLHNYRMYKLNTPNNKNEALDKINSIINGFDYQNADEFENNETYQNLCVTHYITSAVEVFRKTNDLKDIFKIVEGINLANLKEKVIMMLSQSAPFSNLKNAQKLVTYVKESNLSEKLQADISKRYKEFKAWKKTQEKNKLPVGSPSPKFVGFENFKGGTTSLDDLKGSYIYIDVWASWCKPCLTEIPSLKKLKTELKGKNIKFVGISIDQDKNAWKKMVKEKHLGGIQLWQTNKDFSTAYKINAIPRFIIIDTKGNVVDSDASRPSSPDTKNTLMELVK